MHEREAGTELEVDFTSGVIRFSDPSQLKLLVRTARGIAYTCDDYRYFPKNNCSPQTKLLMAIADIVLPSDD